MEGMTNYHNIIEHINSNVILYQYRLQNRAWSYQIVLKHHQNNMNNNKKENNFQRNPFKIHEQTK